MDLHREHDLDAVFAALADPTRRDILRALLDGEKRVSALAEPLPMSLAAVSKHLQVLARAGLVSQLRDGRVRTCRLEPDGLAVAFLWMKGFGAFAQDDYDALERLIEYALDDSDLREEGLERSGLEPPVEVGITSNGKDPRHPQTNQLPDLEA
ncbi:MAG: metalloregulator ArsR/SmtB family transcription factor [Pseudomonadota bacterium]